MSAYSQQLQKDRYVVIDDFEFSRKSKNILDEYSGWNDPSEYMLITATPSHGYYDNGIPDSELQNYSVFVHLIQDRIEDTNGIPVARHRDHFRFSRLVTEIFDRCDIDFDFIGRMVINASFNNSGSNEFNSTPHIDHHNPICKYNIIIYLNDADGDTVLWDNFGAMNKMVEIKPQKYRIAIFDGNIPHATKKTSSGVRKVFVATVY
jgi:hypothetical protein